VKKLYNTARTNLFTLIIIKTWRQEAGARTHDAATTHHSAS
jgi:hypothetical protein